MRVFMAGAMTTGAVTARWNVVRKSSAIPAASCAMQSAVAGATRNRVDGLGDKNVIEGAFEIAAGARTFEDVDVDFVTGQRSKRQRRHELGGAFRHHDDDVEATILKPADNFRRLVARNASADAERDLHCSAASSFGWLFRSCSGMRNLTSPCRISF